MSEQLSHIPKELAVPLEVFSELSLSHPAVLGHARVSNLVHQEKPTNVTLYQHHQAKSLRNDSPN